MPEPSPRRRPSPPTPVDRDGAGLRPAGGRLGPGHRPRHRRSQGRTGVVGRGHRLARTHVGAHRTRTRRRGHPGCRPVVGRDLPVGPPGVGLRGRSTRRGWWRVSCTGQWASTVPVDDRGVPVGPCQLWSDTRGAPHSRGVIAGPVAGYDPVAVMRWIRHSGGAPSTSGADPIGHILHLERDEPDVARAARWYLEPVDYLSMRFTGRAAATPASMAGAWLTDNRRPDVLDYDPVLVRASGVPSAKLPAAGGHRLGDRHRAAGRGRRPRTARRRAGGGRHPGPPLGLCRLRAPCWPSSPTWPSPPPVGSAVRSPRRRPTPSARWPPSPASCPVSGWWPTTRNRAGGPSSGSAMPWPRPANRTGPRPPTTT